MSQTFSSICVYCGSNAGGRPSYTAAAKDLGAYLAKRGIRLIYGGGDVGLMGILANAALDNGGEVVGVIPEKLLQLEVGHRGLTELHVVKDMHERKAKMAELADAFIAMPGGFGTLEETFEVTTWSQLNYHLKPVGLLNVDAYYDQLISFVEHAIKEGFVRDVHADLIKHAEDPESLIALLETSEVARIEDWIEPA